MSIIGGRRVHSLWFGGTGDMAATLNNAAITADWTRNAVGNPVQIVSVAANSHKFSAGSHVYIEGNTEYGGMRSIYSVNANTFTMLLDEGFEYTTETFDGAETMKVALAPGNVPFQLVSFELHLNTASATSENFTVTLDANKGSAYDVLLFSQDMNTETDVFQSYSSDEMYLEAGDVIRFAWANTNGCTWGLVVRYTLGSH